MRYDGASSMTQPPGHPMTLHGVPDGFGHDQTDPWAGCVHPVAERVDNHIGLNRTHTTTDGGTELRGPPHPVSSRKHQRQILPESRSITQ
ncbi:hypothetical protein MALV_35110 [Mycolicibacterium alvei]|uniref:Uncharacterized protein n=1 Tax=Mycolicibacterium alvei TaxID=67081 RepID=A0A6N4UTJ7_9MYCO|nr:hypothetical protein MALV_35110 [Mycolicibacterium alvei]